MEKFNLKKKLEKLTGITNWKFSTQIVEIKSVLNLSQVQIENLHMITNHASEWNASAH